MLLLLWGRKREARVLQQHLQSMKEETVGRVHTRIRTCIHIVGETEKHHRKVRRHPK